MKPIRLVALAVLLAACATTSANRHAVRLSSLAKLVPANSAEVGMAPDLGARLDSIISVGIKEGAAPGVTLAVGRWGRLVHLRGDSDSNPRRHPAESRSCLQSQVTGRS